MTAFKSYSQAGQDRFVRALRPGPGSFIDIGASHPTELSNTYGLELAGWTGLLIERDEYAVRLCREVRTSEVIHGDATQLDYEDVLGQKFDPPVDKIHYLSLDVDENTLASLERIVGTMQKFNRRDLFDIITIEHDLWRFGPKPKQDIESLLKMLGYDLVCEDVCSVEGYPFENWYCSPDLSKNADGLRCKGKKWTDIFPP